MQLINTLIFSGALLVLLYYMVKDGTDISNLYSSRDHIWKEFFKLQQTSKRRHKELLRRIHQLECQFKNHSHPSVELEFLGTAQLKEDGSYEFTRGPNETFQANQKEETGTYSEYHSKGAAD